MLAGINVNIGKVPAFSTTTVTATKVIIKRISFLSENHISERVTPSERERMRERGDN